MISDVLAYARSRMSVLGFTEWADALNIENIPRTVLDTAYHLEMGSVNRVSEHNDNINVSVPFSVRTYIFGYLDTNQARDTAITRADTILDDMLKASNRLTFNCLKTLYFDSMTIEPLANSNDNVIMLKMDFTGLVIKSTR